MAGSKNVSLMSPGMPSDGCRRDYLAESGSDKSVFVAYIFATSCLSPRPWTVTLFREFTTLLSMYARFNKSSQKYIFNACAWIQEPFDGGPPPADPSPPHHFPIPQNGGLDSASADDDDGVSSFSCDDSSCVASRLLI